MKIQGYTLVSEALSTAFDLMPNERVVESYPMCNIKVYRRGESVVDRVLTAKMVITDKKVIFERLSNLFTVSSIWFIKYNQVAAIEIPYQYVKKAYYDQEQDHVYVKSNDGLEIFVSGLLNGAEAARLIHKYLVAANRYE